MPVKVNPPVLVCDDISSNGYGGFKAVYEGLCETVEGTYGFEQRVLNAWWEAWKGFEPPIEFWDGLNLYRSQQLKKFQRDGRAYVFGAVRFLSDRTWESALRIDVRQRMAMASSGADLTDPESVKRAAMVATNKRNAEIAKQQLIEKGFLTA
jgi:hypothetical protein